MAPPTILYNNTNAKYTKYEQVDTEKIADTEVALAKSMLTMDIQTFNEEAPSGNMDINYSLVTPGTSTTQPLTHLMFNQQMNDLGSIFAFAAEHNFDNTNGVTDETAHLSFATTSGAGGNGLVNNLSGSVYVTNNSASYYDSNIVVSTDNSEHVFQDNDDNITKRYEVTFDVVSEGNFNAEKAVNSRYSSFITDEDDNITATPNITKNDPLQIYENSSFNGPDSLYTESLVVRDTTTNILSVDDSITDGMTSLTNSSGQYYFSGNTVFGDGYIGVPDDVVDPNNDRAFFGALRFTQTSEDVIEISGSASGSNSTTLCMVPSNPGSDLPTSMTKTQFDDLFTEEELPYVGQDYHLTIREYLYDITDPSGVTGDGVEGGYYTNGTQVSGPFRGFDTDDTYVKRNTTYMRKCAEEGQNFETSVQTVEIDNGDLLTSATFTGPNADLLINRIDESNTDDNGNPTPYDTDENLNSSQYQNDYWVRTYFTEPSTSVPATYHRAEEAEGNTITYTDFRVVYDSTEGVLSESVLPDDRRDRYYDNFDITTIFPATVAQGNVFSGDDFIGIDNGFAAVFQKELDTDDSLIVKNGINLNSDYTFTSSAAAASAISDSNIAILHINNILTMSNENTMFSDATTGTGIVGTTVSALGENIDLSLFKNTNDDTLSDLRVYFNIKGGNVTGQVASFPTMDSTLTNGWRIRRTTSTVYAVNPIEAGNMFGNTIYDIMSDLNNTVPITITMETNGSSQNRDGLSLFATISWSWDGNSYTNTISGTAITQLTPTFDASVPIGGIVDLVRDQDYRLTNYASNNPLIFSKLANTSLKRRFQTSTFTPQFNLPIGGYTNFGLRGVPMTMLTTYFVLEDANGIKLPDSFLHYLEGINGVSLHATRIIRDVNTKSSTLFTLSAKDLYAAKAVIQKRVGSDWINISPSYNFDTAFNNITTFTLNEGAGKISLSSDMTNQTNPTTGNDIIIGDTTVNYYIGLTIDKLSYSVIGKMWDVDTLEDAQAITTWAATNSIYSTSFPSAGTTIDGLVATVTYTSPESSNFNIQPDLTLTVKDADDVVWARFVTNSKNITSDFNVLFSRTPVFHIVETYKNVDISVDANGVSWTEDETTTSIDTYKMADTTTQLQVIDGVELTFDFDTAITDSASYRLLGDYLQAALYTGYNGTYNSITEVTFDNGLVIGDEYARNIDIKYYRGNSVPTGTTDLSWTSRTSAADNIWFGVTYGNGLFVAVSYDGTDRVMTSPDGITWTSRTAAADNQWKSVTYGNGLFVAVSTSGTGNRVMTSPDGITWTSRTSASDNGWVSVTYGNGLFVAVSGVDPWNLVDSNRVMTSPDGITWTSRTAASDNKWQSVTYGNGLFVAVSDSGTGDRVMTSPDGITWTSRTSAADNDWQNVTYGNGLFVAVSNSGTGDRVMTSPDGITWTSRTAANYNWRSITYGNGVFVAVAAFAPEYGVMVSPNGINWTLSTSAISNSWYSVTYGHGLFVAVSADGTGNRVMTASNIGTYEEFLWTRRPTQIYMKIVNTDAFDNELTYTDTATDLYNGSIHTVTDLDGGIGDLSLKFYGNLSRFRNVNTDYTSQDVEMHQPITILFDAYVWNYTNPYNTTEDGQVNALSDSSGVTFTNEYSIINYTGSNPMNIVAGRVWIRNPNGNSGVEETFDLYYALPTLKVDYLSQQYVGDPSSFDWEDADRIDEISFADLNSGRFIKTPSSNPDGVVDSYIYIKIAPIILQDFVGYSLLARPQIIVDAISTKSISALPYNYDVPVRVTRGIDIIYETNSHYPFAGEFGTHNGTIGGYRVVNDMEVVFNNDELYYDMRFDADLETDKRRKIYIPSNKVTIDLYKGYPDDDHTTIDDALLIATIYTGYIHKIKNYDLDILVDDELVDSTDEDITNPYDSNIYNKYDSTYIDGNFNARNNDMTYDLYFSQDTTIISPGVSSSELYGQLGSRIVNIELESFTPFMDLTGVDVIDRHLDLLPGDSIKLILYGHTFKTDEDGNLVVEYAKYTTGTGYDFSTNAAEILVTNLGFNASTRETATVILKTPSNVLTATPYNFINVCNTIAADPSFNSLTWVTDSDWSTKSTEEKQLNFNMVCLSTIGQAKLTSILGVSTRSPWRMIVCNYPNRIDLRSGDGSPLYEVNCFGKLSNVVTNTQVINLSTESSYNSTNDVEEYGAYNVLMNNTI